MCIFCKIINKELPSRVVYEDDDVLAILDINPAGKGHTLVMPKEHYESLLDLPVDLSNKLIAVTKDLTKQIMTNLKADGCNVFTNINEASGQVIFHHHYHIVPRYYGDEFTINHPKYEFDLDEILKTIKG